MALYNMNQYEKAFHFYQKQVDVLSAQDIDLKEAEEINSADFQRNLATKSLKT